MGCDGEKGFGALGAVELKPGVLKEANFGAHLVNGKRRRLQVQSSKVRECRFDFGFVRCGM